MVLYLLQNILIFITKLFEVDYKIPATCLVFIPVLQRGNYTIFMVGAWPEKSCETLPLKPWRTKSLAVQVEQTHTHTYIRHRGFNRISVPCLLVTSVVLSITTI